MRFIGEYIQDLISRFRNDVYLEDVSTGTIASGGNLGLDSNNKIVKANEVTVHDAVTLAGTLDYITLSGQQITRNAIDLAADVSGTLPVANGGTGQTTLASNSLLTGNGTSGITAESNLIYDGTNLKLTSDGIAAPDLTIESTASHSTAGNLFFNKFRADDTPPDGMMIGLIQWNSEDDANNAQLYAQIIGSAEETGAGAEGGKLQFKVATHDGELQDGIVIEDGDAEDEVDVIIGNTVTSLTTVRGKLKVEGGLGLEVSKNITYGSATTQITQGSVKVTLSTALCNALHTTPVTLVPAQGTNTVIIPTSGMIRVDRASSQNNSAADLQFHYEDQEPGVMFQSVLFQQRRFMNGESGDRVYQIIPGLIATEVSQNLTDDINKAIEVSVDSAFTTNCFTSIEIYLTYNVFDVS